MAVLSGFLINSIATTGNLNPNISSDMLDFQNQWWPPHVSITSQTPQGTLITSWPVEANGVLIQGYRARAYSDDFYYRIYINPASTDVGNVVGSKQISVRLWNAYLTPKIITSLVATGADGIVVSSGPTLPYTFDPLEEIEYIFTVTSDGPAVIDAVFTWDISGESYSTRITGKRSVVFPFEPNYRDSGPVETFSWKTQIITKGTGSEQRIRQRLNPRREFAYPMQLKKDGSQLLKSLAWGWMNRIFAVPVWTDVGFTEAPNAIGSTTVFVNTVDYSYTVGGNALLFNTIYDYEVGEILEVYDNRIVLKTTLTKAWPIHSKVYPVIMGHTPTKLPISRKTGDILETLVSFNTDPGVTEALLPITSAPVVYDGLEVLTMQPNWINDIADEYQYNFDLVDKETGRVAWYPSEDISKTLRNYSWLLKNRAEISEFKGFINRAGGRWKTFWVPSWAHDFDLAAEVSSLSTIMKVFDTGFLTTVGLNPAHDRLMILLKNGTAFYKRITSVELDVGGVYTELGLDSTFGITISPGDVEYICFIDRCRFASDTIDLVWRTSSVVVVQTNFQSVIA